MYTKSGIKLPPSEQRRPKPYGAGGRKRARWSPTMGLAALVEPDGSIAWQDDEWMPNALHDAGEQAILNVWLDETTAVADGMGFNKFLGLLNDGAVAETDGTMTAVTETTGTGYARQQFTSAAQWTNDGLQGGDYRFSGDEKTFGPITAGTMVATHASLSSTLTGAGVLFLTLALSATTTVNTNQSLKYILRVTAS